ncbi:MAG: type II toxin-antitoxin system Phd/YefM family antitoxin [Candidatus Latescibacteria bacterium]|nr:type II toxin-antitoxin system Phd/YefM family antitoxin [Candidatus Latescibacterota bacterium]
MPTQVNIHAAKTHFSQLLDRVSSGEEIVIAKAGKPIARLVPLESRKHQRRPGSAKGKISMAEDFNAPLPAEVLQVFEA